MLSGSIEKQFPKIPGVNCIWITLLLILFSLTGCGRKPANVILIMVDTLRADHLSCYDGTDAETPHIDRIASEGFLFTNIHTAAPTTLASTSSLMTSMYPRMHGTLRNDMSLDKSLLTAAEAFEQLGFNTAGFVSSYALQSSSGIAQGFSVYNEDFTGSLGGFVLQRRAGAVNNAVTSWLEDKPAEPFFLFVHYFDPHVPYAPPPPFDTSTGGYGETPVTGTMEDVRNLKIFLRDGGKIDNRLERMRELYRGEVRYTDSEIGKLLELLEGKGLLDRTLLVFTADHGETFWEHRDMREYIDHGYMVYETTAHIPLIMRMPGRVPVGKSEILASNIDIIPTVFDLLGLEIPRDFMGRSLRKVIDGGEMNEVPVYCEATKPYGRIELGAVFKNDKKPKCVILDGKKLVWLPFWDNLEELYDLRRDPEENKNLLGDESYSAETQKLRSLLRQWSREGSGIARSARSRVDEETLRKLEALGYLMDEKSKK